MATKKELEQKLAMLEAELEARKVPDVPINTTLLKELDALNKKSPVDMGGMRPVRIDDHKNVYLYHCNGFQIGKFVGPLHPHNARVEIERFARRGIKLSVNCPTPDEIKRYKASDEWLALKAEHDKKRSKKIKTRRAGEIERLATAISQMSGKPVTNSISEIPV